MLTVISDLIKELLIDNQFYFIQEVIWCLQNILTEGNNYIFTEFLLNKELNNNILLILLQKEAEKENNQVTIIFNNYYIKIKLKIIQIYYIIIKWGNENKIQNHNLIEVEDQIPAVLLEVLSNSLTNLTNYEIIKFCIEILFIIVKYPC